MPRALGLTWDMVRSALPEPAKLMLLLEYDRVLGLGLDSVPASYPLPGDLRTTITRRHGLRKVADYRKADELRSLISTSGYVVRDTPTETRVRPKTALERQQERWRTVSSSKEVEVRP